ncbi:MAG: hypothetical protein LBV72_01125 [Tannerella sp.]|nr:hypothetical protein [Tannerella sp.]
MINEIFNLVEKYAGEVITNNPDVPDAKKNLAIETTTDAVKDSIKGYLNPTNIAALASMLSGSKSSSQSNSITETLKNAVVGALSNKAGLSSTVSSGIAASLIPMLISVVTKKMNDPNDNVFDVQSLVNAFTHNDGGQGGGLLGALGGLFHK